jgi:hypothetical protein
LSCYCQLYEEECLMLYGLLLFSGVSKEGRVILTTLPFLEKIRLGYFFLSAFLGAAFLVAAFFAGAFLVAIVFPFPNYLGFGGCPPVCRRCKKRENACIFIALSKIFVLYFYSAAFCVTLQQNDGKANKKIAFNEKNFKSPCFMVKKSKTKPPFLGKKGVFQGI